MTFGFTVWRFGFYAFIRALPEWSVRTFKADDYTSKVIRLGRLHLSFRWWR